MHKSHLLCRQCSVEWLIHHLWLLTVDLRVTQGLLGQCTQSERRRRWWERGETVRDVCRGRGWVLTEVQIKINTNMRPDEMSQVLLDEIQYNVAVTWRTDRQLSGMFDLKAMYAEGQTGASVIRNTTLHTNGHKIWGKLDLKREYFPCYRGSGSDINMIHNSK